MYDGLARDQVAPTCPFGGEQNDRAHRKGGMVRRLSSASLARAFLPSYNASRQKQRLRSAKILPLFCCFVSRRGQLHLMNTHRRPFFNHRFTRFHTQAVHSPPKQQGEPAATTAAPPAPAALVARSVVEASSNSGRGWRRMWRSCVPAATSVPHTVRARVGVSIVYVPYLDQRNGLLDTT